MIDVHETGSMMTESRGPTAAASPRARRRVLHCLAVSGIALVYASPVLGQDAPPSAVAVQTDQQTDAAVVAEEPGVGDIIVTAQKRAERLQDVPLSVSAISAEGLASRQINDTRSLALAVPSLSFQQGVNNTNSSIRVRGIGTALFGQGVEPSVSLVVDGVVSARQAQNFADFADLDRIEVLRGPQGTLFGKNATAGVVNVVTSAPSSVFGGSIDGTIAEYNEYRIKGTVTGPLANGLNLRVSGYYNDVGGYIRNLTLNRKEGGGVGYGVRGKLSWDATSNLNLVASADYRHDKQNCCRPVLVSSTNPITRALYAPAEISYKSREVVENVLSRYEAEQETYSLTGNLDLGAAAITSITGYQKYSTIAFSDTDTINTPVPIYTGGGNNPAKQDDQVGELRLHNLTQELRIASTGNRRLNYVAGVFYSDYASRRPFHRRRFLCTAGVIGQPCAAANIIPQSHGINSRLTTDTLAAFAQLDWNVIGGLTLIGGLRAQHEKVAVTGTSVAPFYAGDRPYPGIVPNTGSRSNSDDALTGKAGAQYKFGRDAQVYATYTRGYKGAGYDTESNARFDTQSAVRPEHVNAYEVGFKGQTADRLLTFSAAAFLADYTDLQIQVSSFDSSIGSFVNQQTNAGSSQTKGFEVDATVRPVTGLSLDAHLAYTDASIDVDGQSCPIQFQGAAPTLTSGFPINSCYRASRVVNGATVLSAPIQDIRDGRLPAAPKWRITATPRYEAELGSSGAIAFGQASFTYTSSQIYTYDQDPFLKQDGYTLVDASIGVHTDRLSLTVFVKNVFDKNYVVNYGHSFGLQNTTATPFDLYATFPRDSQRYFGMTAGFKF